MSIQQLSNEVERLGLPIDRPVLSNLENGRRHTVSVPELMVLAAALRVPPLLLAFPLGHTAAAEPLPDVTVSPWQALNWAAGLADGPPDDMKDEVGSVRLYRQHGEIVSRLLAEQRTLRWARQQLADPTLTEVQRAEFELEAPIHETFMTEVADLLTRQRQGMREQGLIPPELTPEVAVLLNGGEPS